MRHTADMNVHDFQNKWRNVTLTERSAAQQHFLDLRELLEHPAPAEADAHGAWYTFEKGVQTTAGGSGFADVSMRGTSSGSTRGTVRTGTLLTNNCYRTAKPWRTHHF
jgi:hypothetical protein